MLQHKRMQREQEAAARQKAEQDALIARQRAEEAIVRQRAE